MEIGWGIVLASVLVGFTVGLTGMGGGALMTPILLIFFGISPTAAVSSDLVAAMVMKPVGGGVHIRRRTVRWELVRWLCLGSIPMAFAGVLLLQTVGDAERIEEITELFLGATLLLAAGAMIVKAWLQGRRTAAARRSGAAEVVSGSLRVRVAATIAIGMVGGLLVGLTSVGSGSIVIICLMLLYPSLRGAELVGTDLVQAVPLVTSAAIAHIIVGDFELGLTASILVGAIPAVWVGARLSSKAPDGVIRPILVFVLTASALKLLGVPNSTLGIVLLTGSLIALPVWGAIDASMHTERRWSDAGLSRATWVRRQAWLAPIGVGFAFAVAYFARIRPQLASRATSVEVVEVLP
ncbi:MAG TPA: sulfite exporter TauE/SafE family protein [Actinomycetota bacterium]|nr:sulfite exporter TauE/SafE family protein [Actinomycetota bacterium]